MIVSFIFLTEHNFNQTTFDTPSNIINFRNFGIWVFL